jgi:hypothetical protein
MLAKGRPCRERRLRATTGGRAILYSPDAFRKRRPGTGRAISLKPRPASTRLARRRRATRGIAGTHRKAWETHRKPLLSFELSGLFLLR